MGAAGQRLGLRLFLEGLEVPVVAANVQIGLNAPATASIQVVPGDKILDLKARTMVHLFYWDYKIDNLDSTVDVQDPEMVAARLGISVDEAQGIIANDPSALDLIDEMQGYKLLFSGEVIGVSFAKTPAGRQAVLQCSDFSTYWDTTYQFFVSYSPNGNFLGTSAAVWAGSDSLFDDLTEGHTSVMNRYLRSKPKTPGLQNVKGLAGGVISLLEAMGGVPKHTHGINDFFTIAELKNHLLQQIVAEEKDNTAQNLFGDKAFMDWLSNGMSSMGQLTTFRDMMKLLFKYVYYEVVPNPAAMYTAAIRPETTKKSFGVAIKSASVAVVHQLTLIITDALGTKPKTAPPNIHVTVASSLIGRLANLMASNEVAPRENLLDSDGNIVGRTRPSSAGARAFSTRARNLARAIESQLKVLKELPTNGNQARLTATLAENQRRWTDILNNLNLLLREITKTQVDYRTKTTRKAPELDRLNTQIFRPDCFFAAPPRCNVLFPESYTQFSYNRNHLQEVTRLRLSVGWLFGGSSGGLLSEVHFAPATSDIRKVAKLQGNKGIRALLPWEIYSGILPKFETVHEMNYVAGRNERKMGINKGKTIGQAKSYPQRVANFNYMKYRFAARTAEVSAKFNPELVCGFPGAIIDRPFIIDPENTQDTEKLNRALEKINKGREKKIARDDMSDHIREIAREIGAPTQYLGMIVALGHNADQSGGGTSLTMTHARTHRITEDDFLNVFAKELTAEVDTEIVTTIIQAEEVLAKGDWKLIKLLIDATDQDMGKKLPALIESEKEKTLDEYEADDTELAGRPDGSPNFLDVPPLSPFAGLLTMPVPEQDYTITDPGGQESPDSRHKLRGGVKKSRLKNSRKVILEPDPYGKLKPGSKGPKGGKVVQVQLFSDDAIMVGGLDVNKTTFLYKPEIIGAGWLDEFTGRRVRVKAVKDGKDYFMWRRIAIHEERKLKTKITKLMPVEEALRPPWFSPLYSNWFIGEMIYQPFFGTGSVVDLALFTSPNGAASFGTGRNQQQDLLDELADADGDHAKILTILEKAKSQNISDVPDIESSLDALAYVYGEVRRLGLDVHRFVNDYTRRPIATMAEMLGSRDLEYRITGDKLQLVKGTPGFHSTAIGDFGGNLLGLVDNPDLELSRLKKGEGKKAPLSKEIDPRPGRRAKVVEYLENINAGSSSLGIGVEG